MCSRGRKHASFCLPGPGQKRTRNRESESHRLQKHEGEKPLEGPCGNYQCHQCLWQSKSDLGSRKGNLADALNFKPGSPWQDAYSRRNYQLGITISQFRTLPYPDQKEWPNAYVVCTDEARSQTFPFHLYISSDLKGAGVV